MKYCCYCRAELVYEIPLDDNRQRYICRQCDTVHYQNPRVVAGCLPVWEDRVLLCKRAIQPRLGYWTLPAGFMELGETTLEAGIRETREEANAQVEVEGLYAVFNLPHVDQVYMMFRSKLRSLDFSPGDESESVELFTEDEIPWSELAFTTIRQTLKYYFVDRESDNYRLHTGDIIRQNEKFIFVPGPVHQESEG